MANDVDRTSHNIDVLVAETRELVAAVRELVNVISERGITMGAEVAGRELPGAITVKPNDEGEK